MKIKFKSQDALARLLFEHIASAKSSRIKNTAPLSLGWTATVAEAICNKDMYTLYELYSGGDSGTLRTRMGTLSCFEELGYHPASKLTTGKNMMKVICDALDIDEKLIELTNREASLNKHMAYQVKQAGHIEINRDGAIESPLSYFTNIYNEGFTQITSHNRKTYIVDESGRGYKLEPSLKALAQAAFDYFACKEELNAHKSLLATSYPENAQAKMLDDDQDAVTSELFEGSDDAWTPGMPLI